MLRSKAAEERASKPGFSVCESKYAALSYLDLGIIALCVIHKRLNYILLARVSYFKIHSKFVIRNESAFQERVWVHFLPFLTDSVRWCTQKKQNPRKPLPANADDEVVCFYLCKEAHYFI